MYSTVGLLFEISLIKSRQFDVFIVERFNSLKGNSGAFLSENEKAKGDVTRVAIWILDVMYLLKTAMAVRKKRMQFC